jgi:GT2 family glycosyltransferase
LTPQEQNSPPERQLPRISVVIVSLDRLELLRGSLGALGADHQVTVVDNGSAGIGALASEFPHVRWQRLPKNFGLTKALNIGIRASEGEYILLLHDDVSIAADALTRLADYLESHTEAGAACPFLTDENGSAVPQVRPLPTSSDADPALQVPPEGEDVTVECVSGAAIMFRGFYLRGLRQIDERYGTYGSIMELCQQLKKSSKKLVVLHSVTAVHEITPSPVRSATLAGDRAAGTAAFLGKHHGLISGILYRIKTALTALITLRFSVLTGAVSGQKIDGTG